MSASLASGPQAWVTACCLLLAALLVPAAARAQGGRAPEIDPERVAAVKAGMLINFARYTQWPDQAFEDAGDKAPVVITVVGDRRIESALIAAARGQIVGGRRVVIRSLEHPVPAPGESEPSAEDIEAFHRRLGESHMVFFGKSERDRYHGALEAMDGSGTLTVSDIDGFAEGGGMLGLTIRDNRVAFDANEEVIRESELRISSQVLKLARIVRSAPTEPDPPPGDGGGP